MSQLIDELVPLFDSMQEHALILTPNRRLGRFLRYQFALYQQSNSQQAWASLQCYSIHGWLHSMWNTLQLDAYPDTDRQLLSALQQELLWEQVIEKDINTGSKLAEDQELALLNTRETARLAMQAWHDLREAGVDQDSDMFPRAVTGHFRRWVKAYQASCDRSRLVDNAHLPWLLTQAVMASRLIAPAQIRLYGFDVMPPAIDALLQAFRDRGAAVDAMEISRPSQVTRMELNDATDEITCAAQWAGKLVENGEQRRIGIVIPALDSERARVERIFNRVFEPGTQLLSTPRHSSGFNISAPVRLAETPLIQSALDTLQLNRHTITLETVSRVLRSPFVGSDMERDGRAMIDTWVRAENHVFSGGRLRSITGRSYELADGSRQRVCPDLNDRLHGLSEYMLASRESRRLPSEWSRRFADQLKIMGWPGDRDLDTIEYQQLHLWQEVLESLSGLDGLCGTCHVEAALGFLQRLAMQQLFHERTADSPVQVLGMLEAAGMTFDHLWVMSMDNMSWPPSPSPNPLIPRRLQAELGLPNASVEASLTFARAMTGRLAASAGEVIFSHCRIQGDQELGPSPLVAHYTAVDRADLSLAPVMHYSNDLFNSTELASRIDDDAPPVKPPETIRGGTQLLRDQAACAFRAFARHRLQATDIEQVVPGIAPAERGMLLHKVMENIWRRLESSDGLLTQSPEQLKIILADAIEAGFESVESLRRIGAGLKALECERLLDLAGKWLEIEKLRAPFKVVLSETGREIKLGDLTLHVRYDRVDELQDGKFFVIDYKTGKAEIKQWAGERPDEPQLPVYCLGYESQVSGAAFALLRTGETGFTGLAEDESIAPGLVHPAKLKRVELPDSWQAILQQWRRELEHLASDFMRGRAAVDPKNRSQTCRYCSLPGLCRVKETPRDETDMGMEGEDGDIQAAS